jgi:hypothetical protein
VPAAKAGLRINLRAAKTEIEALQTDKADVGHQPPLGDVTNTGVLAGFDQVGVGEITPGSARRQGDRHAK